MSKTFPEAATILDKVSKKNRAWRTKESEIKGLRYTTEMITEQHQREEERDQDMDHIKAHKYMLTKHLLAGGAEKVNAVRPAGRHDNLEFDYDEKAKYLNN